MRRHLLVAAPLLALGLALSGCAGQGGGSPTVATAGNGAPAARRARRRATRRGPEVRASACARTASTCPTRSPPPAPARARRAAAVRDQGGSGDKEKVDAAMEECRPLLPNGGETKPLTPEQLERQRELAKCMRENGVPDFPDPDPNGGGGMIREFSQDKGDGDAMRKATRSAARIAGGDLTRQGRRRREACVAASRWWPGSRWSPWARPARPPSGSAARTAVRRAAARCHPDGRGDQADAGGHRGASTARWGTARTTALRPGQRRHGHLAPAAGATVGRGKPLYRVDDEPVVLLYGKLPALPGAAPGVEGTDVKQFEKNLRALGLRRVHRGRRVHLGHRRGGRGVAGGPRRRRDGRGRRSGWSSYAPGAVRVAGHGGAGRRGRAGGEVLTYTGANRVVTVDLDGRRPAAGQGRAPR